MIFKVILSPNAKWIMDIYFESYQGSQNNSDMRQRAFRYSRIISCLAHLNAYTDDVYIFNGKNCLDIDNICRVEFAKEDNEILIEDIVFIN